MKFDTMLLTPNLGEAAAFAEAAEAIGFDGLWTAETKADPFLPLTLVAEHSQQIEMGTAIAVAFPRSPMILAMMAWDLARYSDGRFILGLGTQVRAHNERRLGVKWEKPVRKMRETIEAIHAIWDCWQDGARLNYRGEFFKLTLMTPFFNPGPLPNERPPIYISAVNSHMLRLAGRLCDGVHIHPLHSVKYLREFALPELKIGLDDKGRTRSEIQLSSNIFIVPTDDSQLASNHERFVKEQIAFYMSTPAYRTVIELHGWEETAAQLSRMASRGQWGEMSGLISDEMLDAFAVSGPWAGLPARVHARYDGGLMDRISYYLPYVPGENDDAWRASVAGFKRLARTSNE